MTALKLREQQQDAYHDRAGDAWIDIGLASTARHGTPIERITSMSGSLPAVFKPGAG